MLAVSNNKASLIAKLLYPNEVQLTKIPMFNCESSVNVAASPFVLLWQNKAMNWIILQWEHLFYTLQSESTETTRVNTGL